MKSTAAFRWAEWADRSHSPPPTSPVVGVAVPGHWGIGAAAIWPLGVFSPDVLLKTDPANQTGPGSMSTLPFSCLSKALLNALSGDMDLSLSSVSRSDAIRVQLAVVTFTVTARMPVTSLAWHWLAHM